MNNINNCEKNSNNQICNRISNCNIVSENNLDKNDIEIYLYIDLELEQHDFELVKKCITLHLNTYYKNYKFSKITFCNDLIEQTQTEDVIKNGLITFHNMFKKLKLKTRFTVWFMYMSNGDIQNIYKNTCVILLNTQPNKKECFYNVSKNPFELNLLNKGEKLTQFKNLNDQLKMLISQLNDETAKKISY